MQKETSASQPVVTTSSCVMIAYVSKGPTGSSQRWSICTHAIGTHLKVAKELDLLLDFRLDSVNLRLGPLGRFRLSLDLSC